MSYGFGYLNDLVDKVGTWASFVFAKATPASICEHLRREVGELTDAPNDVEEAADCALLLFHLAHKQGWNLEQAIINKFEKNKARKWGEPDAHGVVEHVRELPLAELLKNVRPATPEELEAQAQSLGKNYKPGERQARPFPEERAK